MTKLKIVDKKNYEYKLEDENNNKYKLVLDFLDVKDKPKIGDYIYINEELLNSRYDGYSTRYVFGNLENKYGKENISIDDIDVIKVIIDNLEIYLKRLYG